MQIDIGSVYDGTVTGLTKFGAFVKLENGASGMVHISEVSNEYVNDISEHLSEGDTVKVKVLEINEKGKISLSIKKALPQEEQQGTRPARPARPAGGYAPRPAGNYSGGGNHTAPRSGGAQQGERSFARAPQPVNPPSAEQSFEDKLKQFLSSSEGRMADLNRNLDGTRGGGRRRR